MTNITQPLVSIIIPSYNRSNYIEKAIQSALEQDYPNLEIIISDNCSTDDSDIIIKKYVHDKRIRYFVNDTNIGMVPNFKIATEQRAQGKYITYLCSDDYLCNTRFISKAIELTNKYPDIILVNGRRVNFYEDTNQIVQVNTDHIFRQDFMPGKELFKRFPKWFFPGWGAILINREKLVQTKVLESRAQSLDYEGNLKLMLQGNIAFLNEPSYVFRRHPHQASGTLNLETEINNLDFIENAYAFAKQMYKEIDLEKWREQVYYTYMNGVARRLIHKKEQLDEFLNYIKIHKKIQLSFLKSPRFFILKNYKKFRFLVKLFRPKIYSAIEKDKLYY